MVKCEICHINDAKYVCSDCGRKVCENCFDPYSWLCIQCLEKRKPTKLLTTYGEERKMNSTYPIIVKSTIIGFIMIFIGAIIIMFSSLLMGGKISTGIIIFPFIPLPLIIGTGPNSEILIVMGLLMVISIILIMIIYWRMGRTDSLNI